LYALSVKNLGKKSKYFIHSLGHGLGLDIHESPSLNAEDKNKIVESCPFTIEPGIYFSGRYGIRIEDTVIIQNNKLFTLTESTKELVIIR
jgi:Xaa-Pro aminopeptidase